MLTIVDTGFNNLGSLLHALRMIGAETRLARSARDIETASGLLLPGVGAFGMAMARLRELGYIEEIIRHARERRRPIAGICLGMQLLLDGSEEHGEHTGLGLIKGHARRLVTTTGADRLPRLGWADVRIDNPHPFLQDSEGDRDFYFAHGYHAACQNADAVRATTSFNGNRIAAIIAENNIIGCQFHPEKSQDAGMDFLAHLVTRFSTDASKSLAAAS